MLLQSIQQDPSTKIEINLEKQTITIENKHKATFEIDPYKKMCLQKGYDDIDFLVSNLAKIEAFEQQHN